MDLSKCYQCKKCTSGCPVSNMAECPPSEMMRRLHLGLGDELLNSDILWMCVSCETCSARCPMGIDVAALMDALRKLAVQRGAAKPEGNVPLFNRAFLKSVQVFGRTYDMAMIAGYCGCLLVRPSEVTGFDDPENPSSLDRLVVAMGGTALE